MRRSLRASALAAIAGMVASCATLQTNGPTQRIAVESTPPGGRVYLDGRAVGVTPAEIVVSRRNADPMIRVEKDGFSAHKRALRRSTSWWLLLDVGVGTLVSVYVFAHRQADGVDPHLGHTIGVAAGATPVILDYLTGAAFKFPPRVDAVLEPTRPRRLEVPEHLRAKLHRSLARAAARSGSGRGGSGRGARASAQDPRLRLPDGVRQSPFSGLHSSAVDPRRVPTSAVGLKPPAQQTVGSVEPDRDVPLGDVEAAGDLGVRAVLNVPELHHLLERRW